MQRTQDLRRVFDPVIIEGKEVELVTITKLLGLTIANNLTWNDHVTEIIKKASKRLYFLTQLKRAGVPKQELALFYVSCVRSVIDYAAPVFFNTSILLYMRCRNSPGCSFKFILYILTYFNMNVLYRIFNIILKVSFWLII